MTKNEYFQTSKIRVKKRKQESVDRWNGYVVMLHAMKRLNDISIYLVLTNEN